MLKLFRHYGRIDRISLGLSFAILCAGCSSETDTGVSLDGTWIAFAGQNEALDLHYNREEEDPIDLELLVNSSQMEISVSYPGSPTSETIFKGSIHANDDGSVAFDMQRLQFTTQYLRSFPGLEKMPAIPSQIGFVADAFQYGPLLLFQNRGNYAWASFVHKGVEDEVKSLIEVNPDKFQLSDNAIGKFVKIIVMEQSDFHQGYFGNTLIRDMPEVFARAEKCVTENINALGLEDGPKGYYVTWGLIELSEMLDLKRSKFVGQSDWKVTPGMETIWNYRLEWEKRHHESFKDLFPGEQLKEVKNKIENLFACKAMWRS